MKCWVVFILIFFLIVPAVVVAETVSGGVAGIVFITQPQSVDPGALSEIITIEAQDSSGAAASLGNETGDLTFTSTSPTGEFLNANGGPVSTVMASNLAHRNFYYRDNTAGNYVLTVTLTGRTSQRSWTATQNIGVGQAVEGGEENNPDNNAITTSGGGSGVTEVVKDKKITTTAPLRVEITKLPPAVVGAPLVFKAKVAGANKDDKSGLLAHWSFGDGGEALGMTVYHVYQFVGKYVVVLSVRAAEEEVVARTVVEVGEPTLEIASVGYDPVPHLQLVNKSNKEIDLGLWQLSDHAHSWNLPVNTIIPPNTKLNLPVDPVRLALAVGTEVSLISPTGRVVAAYGATPTAVPVPTPETQAKISGLRANIDRLVSQVDTMARQEWAAKQASKAVVTVAIPDVPAVAETAPTPVAAAPAVIELPKKASVLERGWQKVKSAFSIKK